MGFFNLKFFIENCWIKPTANGINGIRLKNSLQPMISLAATGLALNPFLIIRTKKF